MDRAYARNAIKGEETTPAYIVAVSPESAQRAELLEICSHLHLDLSAASAGESVLAFMAPPPNSPPYYGFRLTDISHDCFTLGLISDVLADDSAAEQGDGFIEAPDGSRAGFVWKVDAPYAFRTVEDSATRWGVWLVGLDAPWFDRGAIEASFQPIVETLRPHWEAWAATSD
jgi:hypothetical protein